MDDHAQWRAQHLNEGDELARRVAHLRSIAHRDRRASPRFSDMTFADVLGGRTGTTSAYQRACDAYALEGGEYPSEGPGAPSRRQDHLRRYCGLLQHDGRWLSGATTAAALLHEMARATGPVQVRAVGSLGTPAPQGAIASTAAAALTGASYGEPGARRSALHKITSEARASLDPSIDAREVFSVSPCLER